MRKPTGKHDLHANWAAFRSIHYPGQLYVKNTHAAGHTTLGYRVHWILLAFNILASPLVLLMLIGIPIYVYIAFLSLSEPTPTYQKIRSAVLAIVCIFVFPLLIKMGVDSWKSVLPRVAVTIRSSPPAVKIERWAKCLDTKRIGIDDRPTPTLHLAKMRFARQDLRTFGGWNIHEGYIVLIQAEGKVVPVCVSRDKETSEAFIRSLGSWPFDFIDHGAFVIDNLYA